MGTYYYGCKIQKQIGHICYAMFWDIEEDF